jgi:Leucine-rich repeat (LRR) protein
MIQSCTRCSRLLLSLLLLLLQLGRLRFLTELQVYGNKLTALPVSLGLCVKLTLLEAGNNQITAFPPELSSNLVALKELFLYKNQVRHSPFGVRRRCSGWERACVRTHVCLMLAWFLRL